ncbi:AMP-dependent synthetase/ligase [Penicillium cf. griseofulvum]|nr:AMP-dependent synthetase/ligase [Penicillium cf. griseofulvum]
MEIFSEVSAPAVAVASALSVAAGAYLNAKLAISTDLRAIANDKAGLTRLTDRIAALDGSPTIYKMLERAVDLEGRGTAEALWFEHKTWSYSQLKDLADKMAALLKSRDINTGDTVAVFTTNSPEMVVTLYALSKLGAVAAMINTSLRDDTFIHCLGVSGSKLIISTADISQHICADLPHFTYNMGSFEDAEIGSAELVTSETLQQFSPLGIAAAKRTTKDISVLIYTSGTTGKPKACGIRNLLAMITSTPLSIDVNNPKKYQPFRVYSPLPLFHGTAFFIGLCSAIGNGGTLCLGRKFSASRFWKEVHDSGATRILYIGELCRYLLGTPPSPYDQDHKCIVASGNGLRGEIWEKFRKRFNVPEIREFYRSTEGIAKFDNFGVGAWGAGKIGFAGPIRRFVEDVTFIVKYDTDTDMPYRDPVTGFCVKAALGEEGEAIGRVRDRGTVIEYLGNKGATEEKLLRDVFQKGDLFQRTGDLVVQDESGWVRFQDRVGDTFRWKGENVSAGEIRDHICRIEGVHDAVVYGVKLNGYDGQAGAAGITLESPSVETEFMLNLYKQLKKKGVPSYALPRLVRLTEKVATGVTFKQAKGDLAKKGWDPRQDWGGDVLYWLDGTKYQKLEEQSWAQIESGKAKL